MSGPIVWETPRNGFGHPCTDLRLGTVEGSTRQYLMIQVPDGWKVSTREDTDADWVAFPLDVTDFQRAVAHRVEVLAVGPTHPDALREAIDRSPTIVDELAAAIHEADWMMAGGEWRWSRATDRAKEASRRIARTVLLCYATDPDTPWFETDVIDIINHQWTDQPRHGAKRRVDAKAEKAIAWLRSNTPNFTTEKAPS